MVVTQITSIQQLTELMESPGRQEKSSNLWHQTPSAIFLVVPGVMSSGDKMLALSQNPVLWVSLVSLFHARWNISKDSAQENLQFGPS